MGDLLTCDQINTYNYQLKLPTSGFFTISFSCNGITTTSPEFNSTSDALMWAQDILGGDGTWSLVGNTLYLVDSLCGVGSIGLQVINVEVTPPPDPDDPTSYALELFSTNPEEILDIYGISAVDESIKEQRANDTEFIDALELLRADYIEPITGTTSQWPKYSALMDGYGFQSSEVTARGKNLATLLGGVGNKHYGYSFLGDAIGYIIQMTPQPEIVITMDLIRPPLLGSYSATYAEIDYVVSACATAGVSIKFIQLCYELGNKSNNDVFSTAQQIADVTQTVADYINANYPTIEIGIDAANWDDESVYFHGLSEAMNNVTGIDYVRQYLFFDGTLSDLEANLDYVVTAVDAMVAYFTATFTHGQKLILAQPNILGSGTSGGMPNPFRLKVGEGIILSDLLMYVIDKNILTGGLIANYTHYNLSRMIALNNDIYPAYYFMLLMRGGMQNDGRIRFNVNDSAASNLRIQAYKKGSQAEIRVINATGDFVTLNGITLDGTPKNLTVESYYGDPFQDTQTHYTSSGTTALIYPNSLTKITTT